MALPEPRVPEIASSTIGDLTLTQDRTCVELCRRPLVSVLLSGNTGCPPAGRCRTGAAFSVRLERPDALFGYGVRVVLHRSRALRRQR